MTVPHLFQASEQTCGAACLRMLFAAMGVLRDEATIAKCCEMTALGCTVQDLVRGAQSMGLNAEVLPIRRETEAIAALSNSAPFVAMIDLANMYGRGLMFQWHFVVMLALADDNVTFHDPADGPNRRVTLEQFLAGWASSAYRGVRVWTP